MGIIKKLKQSLIVFIVSAGIFLNLDLPVNAQTTSGQVIQIGSLDTLLWSIVSTIQFYTLPIMAISLAFIGINLVASGDDPHAKSMLKGWIVKILIGGFIVFGAATLANILKTTLS